MIVLWGGGAWLLSITWLVLLTGGAAVEGSGVDAYVRWKDAPSIVIATRDSI
jgi:hypothetical protein